jgi:signal transduction histidine kinase
MPQNPRNLILLVDENEMSRRATAQHLQSAGFEISETVTSAEALKLAQKNPALIIIEIKIPDMSGFDLCAKLKADAVTASIPILLASPAFAQSENQVRGLESGANGYLVTPARPEELIASIRALLCQAEKMAKEKVFQQTAELQRTVKSLDTFCYTIAHDLKSPLRSIKGFTIILRDEYSEKFDDVGKDYARRIVDSVERMNRLIDDLLDYGRLSNMELPLHPIRLEEEIQFVLNELWADAKSRQAKIEVSKPIFNVQANATVVRQVLSNLIANALKFVEPGKCPEISISSERIEESVRIYIQDNGIGIDPNCFKRIFDVFERLHGKDSIYAGTGIGLAIVRKGAERMGGKAGLESEPGKGSRFWLELPAAEE